MYCRDSVWFPFLGDLTQAVFFPIRVQIRAKSADNYLCAINIRVFTSSSLPPLQPCLCLLLSRLMSHRSSVPLSRRGRRWSEASSFVIPLNTVDSPSEPQFHISSRKMPAPTVAGSRFKRWRGSGVLGS